MCKFKMSDLGKLTHYLSIEVEQRCGETTLKQSQYAKKILQMTGLLECNSAKHPMEHKLRLHKDLNGELVDATEYRRIIGCLRYLLHTRPDLSFAVGMVSRYMERPTKAHYMAVKHILRYLKGTISFGLKYTAGDHGVYLCCYSDSDLAGDLDDRRSTGGMVFYFNNCPVSWSSQKQRTVALSTCEAELMAAAAATCQAIWLMGVLKEMIGSHPLKTTLFVDNQSAMDLIKNPVHHARSKHIDTRFYFIRECVEHGQIQVRHVNSNEQRADIMTKALLSTKFILMRELLGVRDLDSSQD